MSLDNLVIKTRQSCDALAVAVISRDGAVIAADMPENLGKETFSIMCATILGAGMTAAHELGRTAPERIILESKDLKVVIRESGRRSMVVAVVEPGTDMDKLDIKLKELIATAAVQI